MLSAAEFERRIATTFQIERRQTGLFGTNRNETERIESTSMGFNVDESQKDDRREKMNLQTEEMFFVDKEKTETGSR
jgi:hypothetical protein